MFENTVMYRFWRRCRGYSFLVNAVAAIFCMFLGVRFGFCADYDIIQNKTPEMVRDNMENMKIRVADKALYEVKVAKTTDEITTGLMNVFHLSDGVGMIFDLRNYPGASMWMKNTYVSLDMLFINCEWEVVDIYENATPHSLRRIGSSKPFCYVLEIKGGDVAAQGIAPGDRIMPDHLI